MPDGISHFGQIDGVWIACPPAALPLSCALRQVLIEAARERVASQNQNEKQAALYAMLAGSEFKQRVEGILEPLLALISEHDRERRALEAAVARREKLIEQALSSLAVLYGGVSGIVGGALPRIDRLELSDPGSRVA